MVEWYFICTFTTTNMRSLLHQLASSYVNLSYVLIVFL